jgi:methyl-accepting chemotaxis protein
MAEISAASQEQASGIEQVGHTVVQMDEVTQQNAALVEEASAAARAMQEQADELRRQMMFFQLHDDVPAMPVAVASARLARIEPAQRKAPAGAEPRAVAVAGGWTEF